MKPLNRRTIVPALMACGALLGNTFAQTAPPSIDDEIMRLQKDLVQTQIDMDRTVQETEKDQKDFEAYQRRTSQRMAQIGNQLDTLKSEIAFQSHGNDSVSAQIRSVLAQRREIELSQEEFRQKLISLCNEVQPAVKKLPPIIMVPTLSALSLLVNDLSSKSIDLVEGCTRLVQVLNKLDEASSEIQVSEEHSPVPEIRGTVYRLRIGTFFEAVVDEKGEHCAVFKGWGDDGGPTWEKINSPAIAAALLRAVNIREGKSLPAFVNLPVALHGGDK
jgi:hypothetical protein